jgi:uncharacterized protein (TIGR03000 family)
MYSVVLLMALSGSADVPDCHRHSCTGGSCGGYVVASCGGCTGGGHHHARHHRDHSCHGCTGGGCTGMAYYGGCCGSAPVYYGCTGGVMYPPPPKDKEKIKDLPKEKKDKEKEETSATIVVSLPADAQLTIDGAATTSTSTVRTFVTPELTPAKEFVYNLTAKIVRGGETLTVTETVTVKAGVETRVNLGTEKFTALTAAK